MNRKDLSYMTHHELLERIKCQLGIAQSVGLHPDMFRYINPPPDPSIPTPLVTFGDFEIWPRFE